MNPKDNEPTDPFEMFYAIIDRQSPEVKRAQRLKTLVWDPWPARRTGRGDAILETAQKLVEQRNSDCVDICIFKVALLPASGSFPGVQGGSRGLALYSLRSPNHLPVRVHLWQIPRQGLDWNDEIIGR